MDDGMWYTPYSLQYGRSRSEYATTTGSVTLDGNRMVSDSFLRWYIVDVSCGIVSSRAYGYVTSLSTASEARGFVQVLIVISARAVLLNFFILQGHAVESMRGSECPINGQLVGSVLWLRGWQRLPQSAVHGQLPTRHDIVLR
ncbi:hypothetical protein F4818DRAFT_446456 [Hypoxylon cercidicola]|nr:hypothetical protein F4818DRAFT_446456 [Hypoxylon cercidicola]